MPTFLGLLLQGIVSQILATQLRQTLSQLTPFPNFRLSYYVASKKAEQWMSGLEKIWYLIRRKKVTEMQALELVQNMDLTIES